MAPAPVDLVCGGERKVACVTLAETGGGGRGKQRPDPPPAAAAAVADDPDFPVESFEVRIGNQIEWRVLKAVYAREDSTKGSTNPKFSHANSRGPAVSNTQLFSANVKAKPPIIGLPSKIQHSGYDGRCARRPPRVRKFPKKAGRAAAGGGRGKSVVPEFEPGSPKVSCFGKVLAQSERERRRREWRRAVAAEEEEEGEGRGWWRGFLAIFRGGRGDRAVEEEKEVTVPSKNIPGPVERESESAAVAAPGPGIGGMRRFASGRRAASWASEAGA